jgi:hypothetical protein
MCIIAAKPAGVAWPEEKYIRACYDGNPDGVGMAWADKSGLHVWKKSTSWQSFWKHLKAVEECSVLMHCRYATNGSIRTKNCHPFLLPNGVAMVHNGIIDIEPLKKDMTDSETFGLSYIAPFSAKELRKPHVKGLLETAIGSRNKIVMLDRRGEFIFLNKEAGEEFEGIWFSNHGYIPYVPQPKMSFHSPWMNQYDANEVSDVPEMCEGDCGLCPVDLWENCPVVGMDPFYAGDESPPRGGYSRKDERLLEFEELEDEMDDKYEKYWCNLYHSAKRTKNEGGS